MPRDLAPWFVMIDGQESGPMSVANLSQRFAAGEIDGDSYAWKDGMDEWLPASEIEDLAAVFAPKPAARRPPPPPAAAKAQKAKPKAGAPEPDSHVFKGRDDDSEEIVLELDFGAEQKKPASNRSAPSKPGTPGITPAKGTNAPGITPAKGTSAPAKPAAAAPAAAAPSGPKFGGAAKPPSQEYGVPIGEAPKGAGRALPKAPASLADEDDEDWANRTSVEPLPFGERVHQEKVASSLFESTDPNALPPVGKTGSYALDMSSWASAQMKKPPSVDAKPATESAPASPKAATPATPAMATPARANPVLRPPSSSGIAQNRQPSTALRQPLPDAAPKSRLMIALVAGGVVLACSIALILHFAMK